jgi:uncharacterized protein (TIGR01244 family)
MKPTTGVRSIAAAAVLSLACAMPGHAQVEKRDVAGIVNFSRVDATIGCGGATETAALAELGKLGFRSVINLRLETETGVDLPAARSAAKAAGLKYFHVPFDGSNLEAPTVDAFLETVRARENQPVYIHCASANRVGAMWLIKRVVADGWTVEHATEEARAIGLTSDRLLALALDYLEKRQG